MELGAKIKAARLEAGLSQRQLCGEIITRNMLSQIENGSARPSMDTLGRLAQRLGKSVSYFLEETAVTSPNVQVMADARRAWGAGDAAQALKILEAYRGPDDTFDGEKDLLSRLCLLDMAAQALREGRRPYARTLLERAGAGEGLYFGPELERRRVLALAQTLETGVAALAEALPEDGEPVFRARAALEREDFLQAGAWLDAAQARDARWHLLRGQAHLGLGEYAPAAEHLKKAEGAFPEEAVPRLEICCRELGDYQGAYEYALKQRK